MAETIEVKENPAAVVTDREVAAEWRPHGCGFHVDNFASNPIALAYVTAANGAVMLVWCKVGQNCSTVRRRPSAVMRIFGQFERNPTVAISPPVTAIPYVVSLREAVAIRRGAAVTGEPCSHVVAQG